MFLSRSAPIARGGGRGRLRRMTVLMALAVAVAALSMTGAGTGAGAGPATPQEMLEQFWANTYGTAGLQGTDVPGTLERTLLAKAKPDECYAGIGNPYPAGPDAAGNCPEGSQPKVNQSYVWGVAKSGDDIWFGTAANVMCQAIGMVFDPSLLPSELSSIFTNGIQMPSTVCEFGKSQPAQMMGVPAPYGDWRAPDIFIYNTQSGKLTEKTAEVGDTALLNTTLGLRAAGAHGGVAFLAGPSLTGGVNMFAFRTDTGAYIGSKNFVDLNNVRRFIVVNGVMYAGVGTSAGGKILRWTGDLSAPFAFDTVGTISDDAADLVEHRGRLYVSSWPLGFGTTVGLWMSPPLGVGGLTTADASGWQKVWDYGKYDPDPVTAMTHFGGALASYGGHLYWGSMHVPMFSAAFHGAVYGQSPDQAALLARLIGTHRPISIFRVAGFAAGENDDVELLYGLSKMPVWVAGPAPESTTESTLGGHWALQPNKLAEGGEMPRFGPAGFGNPFNTYTWSMAVFKGQLFVGTFDWSYPLADGLSLIQGMLKMPTDTAMPFPLSMATNNLGTHGADLWRFPASHFRALPESVAGVNNYTNYGVRNLLADDALYLGMANAMNMLTDPADGVPEGGWELIRLGGQRGPEGPAGPAGAAGAPGVVSAGGAVAPSAAGKPKVRVTQRGKRLGYAWMALMTAPTSGTYKLHIERGKATVKGNNIIFRLKDARRLGSVRLVGKVQKSLRIGRLAAGTYRFVLTGADARGATVSASAVFVVSPAAARLR